MLLLLAYMRFEVTKRGAFLSADEPENCESAKMKIAEKYLKRRNV
jgi:hypothetical protein